jgi:hypothetical protein
VSISVVFKYKIVKYMRRIIAQKESSISPQKPFEVAVKYS